MKFSIKDFFSKCDQLKKLHKQEKLIWRIKFEEKNLSVLANSFMRKDLSKNKNEYQLLFKITKNFGTNKPLWNTNSKKHSVRDHEGQYFAETWFRGYLALESTLMLWHFSIEISMSWFCIHQKNILESQSRCLCASTASHLFLLDILCCLINDHKWVTNLCRLFDQIFCVIN